MQQMAAQAQRTAQQSQQAARSMGQVGVNFTQLGRSISSIQNPMSLLGGAASDLYYHMTRLGLIVWSANQVFNTMSGLGNAVMSANADWEQYNATMGVLLKSETLARAEMEKLSQYARKTPFTLPQVMEETKLLMAYGTAIEDIIPILTTVGDAAMGDATKFDRIIVALGQMKAAGKVNAQDMRQLTEAYIPAWAILAESIGVTEGKVRELVEQGVVPADQAMQALLAGMQQRFGGLGATMAKTEKGIVSNLEDWMFRARTILMQNVFDTLKVQLERLLATVDTPEFEMKLAEWGQGLGDLTTNAIDFGQRAIPAIQQALQGAKQIADTLGEAWAKLPTEQQVGMIGIGAMYFVGPAFVGMLQTALGLTVAINGALAGIPATLAMALATGALLNASWRIMSGQAKDLGEAMGQVMQGYAKWGEYAWKQTAAALDPGSLEAYQVRVDNAGLAWEEANRKVEENQQAIAQLTANLEALQGMPIQDKMAQAALMSQLDNLRGQQHQLIVNRNLALQMWKDMEAQANEFADVPPFIERITNSTISRIGENVISMYDKVQAQIEGNPLHIQADLSDLSAQMGGAAAAIHALQTSQLSPAPPSTTPYEDMRAYERQLDQASNKKLDWSGVIGGTGAGNTALKGMQRELQRLQKELSKTQKAIDQMVNSARLPGMQQAEDEIFALEMALNRAQRAALGVPDAINDANQDTAEVFDLLAAQQRELAEGIPVALTKYEWDQEQAARKAEEAMRKAQESAQAIGETPEDKAVEAAQNALEAARLDYEYNYQPKLRDIKETWETLTGQNVETPFAQIMADLPGMIANEQQLQALVDAQQAAMEGEQDSVAAMKADTGEILNTRAAGLGVEETYAQQYEREEAAIRAQLDLTRQLQQAQGILSPENPYETRNYALGGTTGDGWSLVGEAGPELVRLPSASQVFNNAATRAAMQAVIPSYMINNSRQTTNLGGNQFIVNEAQQPYSTMDRFAQDMRFRRLTQGRA